MKFPRKSVYELEYTRLTLAITPMMFPLLPLSTRHPGEGSWQISTTTALRNPSLLKAWYPLILFKDPIAHLFQDPTTLVPMMSRPKVLAVWVQWGNKLVIWRSP